MPAHRFSSPRLPILGLAVFRLSTVRRIPLGGAFLCNGAGDAGLSPKRPIARPVEPARIELATSCLQIDESKHRITARNRLNRYWAA